MTPPGRWLLLLGGLLVIASAWLARGVGFSADPAAHFPRQSASVRGWLELSLRFDAFNTLIVGLEEPVAPLIGLERVKRITTRLEALKASGVLAVASVSNVESIHEAADGSLETELLIPSLPADKAALDALAVKIAADSQVLGALISRDQRGYLIILRADPRRDPAELAEAIRAVVEAEQGPLVATYFGAPFFQAVIDRAIRAQLGWLIPALALVLFTLLALLVRSVRATALVLGSAALCLVVWLGALPLLGIVLTPTSLPAAALLWVLAVLAFARMLEPGLGSAVSAEPRPIERFGGGSPAGHSAHPERVEGRGRAVETREAPFAPSPQQVAFAGLAAIGLASLALLTIPQLASFAAAMAAGAGAIALVGLLLFAPLAKVLAEKSAAPASPRPPTLRLSPAIGLALAALALAGLGAVARQARFHGTPQTLFSPSDEVGASLSFFDRRFGGPDFIQVEYRGDLRDPELAARLLRLTDLLEGPDAFGDVRAVAPILGFLNHGFGGVHRIPTSRESLNNLWFFLEGRPDVRNLVSDQRDEAMVVLRVPTRLPRPIGELTALVDRAVAGSLEQGRASTRLRLTALAELFALPTTRVDELLDAPARDPKEAVSAALRRWLASGDSPFQPDEAQWKQLEAALGEPDRIAKLTAVASSFAELGDPAHAAQLVESVLAREKDLRLNLSALALVDRLWDAAAPPAARFRAQGIFADHLDPHPGSGQRAAITITGLPVVAAQLEQDSLAALWRALGLLIGVAALAMGVLTRSPGATFRATLEAALAAAATLALAGTAGFGIDPGSFGIFLLPPLAAFLVSGTQRFPVAFCLALGASGAVLLFVGVLPISRIGAALAVGLAAVALVHSASRRVTARPAV